MKPKKGKAASGGAEEGEPFELVPNEPLGPAWDDSVSVSFRGSSYHLRIAALNTDLPAVTRTGEDYSGGDETAGKPVFISLPAYEAPNVQLNSSEDDFQLEAQCLVHLATPDEEQGGGGQTAADGVCLFLYQVRLSRGRVVSP